MDRPEGLCAAVLVDAIQGRNGVGTYFHDLADQFRKPDERFVLFCPRGSGGDPFQGPSIRMPGDSTQRLYFPRAFRLWRALRRLEPQVIVLSTPGPYGMLGFVFALYHGIPIGFAYQTDYVRLMRLYWRGWIPAIARRFLGALQGLFLRSAARVFAISEDMAADARAAGALDVELVGTPIAAAFLVAAPQPLRQPPRRVLFVGRLAPEKNVERVTTAAKDLPEYTFGIVGDGPLRANVEAAARESSNIVYHGWCSRPEVGARLDEADMLVLPSSVEAFGTVVIEALSRGRLVIASTACGVTQWPAIASALVVLQEDEPLAQAIGRVEAMDDSERVNRAERGRQAALSLNAATANQWRSALSYLAVQGKRRSSAGRRAARTLALTSRILSFNGWLF